MKYYFDENVRQQKGMISVEGLTCYPDPRHCHLHRGGCL